MWVVKTSEMLATDNDNGRLLRSGLVANLLDARGHTVTWWMSTFDHANRRNRAQSDIETPFGTRGVIRMLHSPGYRASVSLRRLRDHARWGRAFRRRIAQAPRPDIIFCAYPTIEAAAVCAEFGRRHGIPVVLDLRDMWPDIFSEYVPAPVRPLARWLLWPWHMRARAALQEATALFAITEEFLAWGLRLAGRERRRWDGAFMLAYPEFDEGSGNGSAELEAGEYWDRAGIKARGSFNVALVGSMTRRRFEMPTVVAAARLLQKEGAGIKFVLAGDGGDLNHYRMLAQDCGNVIFPGWLSAARIRELLARSHVGLVPYRNTPDLVMSVPNKVGEYLAAGVPVATCLQGTLARLLARGDCGVSFGAHDPESLAARLRELRADEPRRLELSAHARQVYLGELAAASVYGRLVERLEAMTRAAEEQSQSEADRISVRT